MTQEEFIKVLDKKKYSYKIQGNKIVVIGGYVYLDALTSLPPGVKFKNEGDVWLQSLTSLPPGVVFENRRGVYLRALTSLPPGVVFKNRGRVWLESLSSLPPGVVFSNEGDVKLNSLTGNWFSKWKGNIERIDSKRLLNSMISKGVFER
jgi:hypothetical protein